MTARRSVARAVLFSSEHVVYTVTGATLDVHFHFAEIKLVSVDVNNTFCNTISKNCVASKRYQTMV